VGFYIVDTSGITTSNDSLPTPPLSYSPLSTDSSSGDRTIPISSFIDIVLPANLFLPCNTSDKVPPLSLDQQVPTNTYTVSCGKKVITSRISGPDKYRRVVLVVRWGVFSPIVGI
jgi:hypothetical protein